MRPFASGELPPRVGLIAAPVLMLAGTTIGAAAGDLPVLALYGALSLAYSFYLKSRPLVDVFALAALYTARFVGGGIATGYAVSVWLLAFSSFLFLSLALVKRVAELQTLTPTAGTAVAGRGYAAGDQHILTTMGIAASFVASLVLAFYVQNEAVPPGDLRPTLAWGIVPLILFWQCRIWLLTKRGDMHHDPIVFAARDWVSWLVTAASFAMLLFGNKAMVLGR